MRNITIICLLLVAFTTQAQTLILNKPDFSAIYPANWDTLSQQGIPCILSPLDSDDDNFRENINIISESAKAAGNITLEEYFDLNLTNIKDGLGDEAGNLKVSDITVGHYKDAAKLIEYTTTRLMPDGSALKLYQILTLSGSKFYIISFTSLPNTFDKYLPQVKLIFDSLRFK